MSSKLIHNHTLAELGFINFSKHTDCFLPVIHAVKMAVIKARMNTRLSTLSPTLLWKEHNTMSKKYNKIRHFMSLNSGLSTTWVIIFMDVYMHHFLVHTKTL